MMLVYYIKIRRINNMEIIIKGNSSESEKAVEILQEISKYISI